MIIQKKYNDYFIENGQELTKPFYYRKISVDNEDKLTNMEDKYVKC